MIRRGAVAIVLLCLLHTGTASAQVGSVQAGWWTSAPVATAPDTGDGLLVQGGATADRPLAFAAVSASLLSAARPTAVKLTVKPGSASTPGTTLVVCPLAEPFEPARGGSAQDAPDYDCTVRVTAKASSGNPFYRFDLSSIPASTVLAIAILPTAATDRVVLSVPDPAAFEQPAVTALDAVPPRSNPTSTELPAPPSQPGATAATVSPLETPASPPVATTERDERPAVGRRTHDRVQLGAQPARSPAGGGRSLAPFVFAGLALAAAALWRFAGQETEEERREEEGHVP